MVGVADMGKWVKIALRAEVSVSWGILEVEEVCESGFSGWCGGAGPSELAP